MKSIPKKEKDDLKLIINCCINKAKAACSDFECRLVLQEIIKILSDVEL